MFTLFFGDKTVIFASGDQPDALPLAAESEVVTLAPGQRIGIAKMLEKLENSKRVLVKTDDPEAVFGSFASEFVRVEAAGGVVRDRRGRVLMIYRNGRWDLPKGHVEQGETPEMAAVREVEEETGASGVVAKDIITGTLHFYKMNGRWELKHTVWYDMTGMGETLSPQQEEGITRVEWVGGGDIAVYAESCFPSVQEVLRRASLVM